LSAFDEAWNLTKSDFYFGSDDPKKEAGFHSTGGWTHGMEGADKLDFRGRDYITGVNLNHPIYRYKDWLSDSKQTLTDDERIKRIIDTIIHEEGHEAIYQPLVETKNLEFEDEGYEPYYYSESYPSTLPQEYGAMLIEGMSKDEIEAELKRRNIM